jgi:hypothetical protein
MQGVAARKQLEIARAQREATDQALTASGQHRADVVEIFRSCRPDVRAVFKYTTGQWLLGEHADRELVRVEVPRMRPARSHDVEAQPGQRIRQLVDPGQPKQLAMKC